MHLLANRGVSLPCGLKAKNCRTGRCCPRSPIGPVAWTLSGSPARQVLSSVLKRFSMGRLRPMMKPATCRTAGTSKLSPHVHFGEVSPRRLWHRAAEQGRGKGVQTFLKELLWREFSLNLLWEHKDLRTVPIRAEFADFPWDERRGDLAAWQRGQTGIPIVDAGMRELWQTGWMHNRVRMIVASFLTKHLLVPWQAGEAWFWDTLCEADEAANGASWQWVAGCGADAAPYFRVFNPVLQGRKFDGEGTYVRSYVPEIAGLPDKYLHAPWEAPEEVLNDAQLTLGKEYPKPIIDLKEGRARALCAYEKMKAHA
jgi:deoxyribodipyrimidine photo-lyase